MKGSLLTAVHEQPVPVTFTLTFFLPPLAASVMSVALRVKVQEFVPPPCVTVTLNVQVLVLPAESVAVQCTGVVPSLKDEPEAGVLETVGTPQLSLANGVAKLTFILVTPEGTLVMMSPGQVIEGGVPSTTVTNAMQEAAFAKLSVMLSVTWVTPRG